MSITGVPLDLAKRNNADAHSRTWATLPGELSMLSVLIVCMESTTTRLGRRVLYVCKDALKRRVAEYHAIVGGRMGYPFGSHLQLVGALLAADVKYAAVGHSQYCLQRKRALAYARLTAEQDYRAGHKPAPKHPVEFSVVHVYARLVLGGYLAQEQRARLVVLQLSAQRGRGRSGCGLAVVGRHAYFLKCVPLAAIRALAYPFGRLLPAIRADVRYLVFRHFQ